MQQKETLNSKLAIEFILTKVKIKIEEKKKLSKKIHLQKINFRSLNPS